MTELDPMAITSTVPPATERGCAALAIGGWLALCRPEEAAPVAR